MANYKVLVENSTLGPVGSIVTDADIIAAPADVDLLVAAKVVEPTTTSKKDKE
jgi:hypothetical protein